MMNITKKTLFGLVLLSFLVFPVIGLTGVDPAPDIELEAGLLIVVNVIFTILMAVAVVFVMIGAFMFVAAGGDAEKVTAAREKILYAVIAVVVALLARGIIDFIKDAFPTT